jgi:CHAD domain-containing protein
VRRKASVKGVHDLRVALRRLEEVTRLFGPLLPERAVRRLRRRSRSIRWSLGPVRSADVTTGLLREIERTAKPDLRPSVRRLRRAAAGRARRLREKKSRAMPDLGPRLRILRKRLPGDGAALRRGAARVLEQRVAEVAEARRGCARGGRDAFHDLRIAARRLRYVLEAIGEMGYAGTEGAIAGARRLQERLGRLRDEELLLDWALRSRSPRLEHGLETHLRRRVQAAHRAARRAAASFRPERGLARVSGALRRELP